MQYITLAKQQRPVNFGRAAIMRLEELTGRSFYEFVFSLLPESQQSGDALKVGLSIVQKTSVTNMVNILCAGLYGGALKTGQTPLSKEEVIDLLDEEEDSLTLLIQVVSMVFETLPKPAGDNGQKKSQPKESRQRK